MPGLLREAVNDQESRFQAERQSTREAFRGNDQLP